jgi:hypothetical protein
MIENVAKDLCNHEKVEQHWDVSPDHDLGIACEYQSRRLLSHFCVLLTQLSARDCLPLIRSQRVFSKRKQSAI